MKVSRKNSARVMSQIPDKLYFKIGEVAQIAEVEPYVLRYWESEFKEINPVKSKSHQRLYRKKDIETVLLIKQLLYQEKFTIEGAKQRIRELGQLPLTFDPGQDGTLLRELRKGLQDLLKILKMPHSGEGG